MKYTKTRITADYSAYDSRYYIICDIFATAAGYLSAGFEET